MPNGLHYKKGFSQPYSNTTYEDSNSLRYVYHRTKEEDLYVVPYHAPTLFLWNGHINFQYVTTCQFAKYMRSEEHTSELQSRSDLVCRLLLEKKKIINFAN